MNILGRLFLHDAARSERRALANFQRQTPAIDLMDATDVVRQLDGPDAITFGSLPTGELVRLTSPYLDASGALIAGSTNTGKSTLARLIARQKIQRGITRLEAGLDLGFELDLVDAKNELADLVKQELAAAWMAATPRVRDRLPKLVRVDGFSEGRITPFCPFGVPPGASPAFIGFTRAEVSAQVLGNVPDATRRVMQMFGWFLAERGWPPHPGMTLRFFSDEAYRAEQLKGVPTELREYFTNLRAFSSQASIDAAIRWLVPPSIPEHSLATNIAPSDVERLGLVTEAPIRIGGYASAVIPREVVMERAAWHITDSLRAASGRRAETWRTMIFDEVLRLLAECEGIADGIADGIRTFRTARTGMILIAQEFTGALPPRLLAALTTNAGWMAGFQTQTDAPAFFAHAAPATGGSHTDRLRSFTREMANLPQRHYRLRVRGFPLLAVIAPDVRPATALVGVSEEHLRTVFDREIAPSSTVDPKTAKELIARWEATALPDAAPEPVKRRRKAPKPEFGSLSDLMRHVAREDE